MTKLEYAQALTKQKYSMYNIELPFEKLQWSGELVDVTLNDGTVEVVDRLVEFTLCSLYSYYFIDRYARTLDPKKGPMPFKLFDFQKKALEDFQKHKRIIFRKCRQVGASVITGAYALWRANFQKAQIIRIVSLSQADSLEFKEKTIDIDYEEMPGFLKSKTTRDGNSRTKLKLMNGSQIRVLPKSKNAGRGSTPSLMIIDEAAFNEYMDDIWRAVEPALDHGGDVIVISTTNGVGNWYHLTYTRAEQSLNAFHPIFIPWWRYPGRDNPWLDDILSGKIKDVEAFTKQKELEALSYQGPIEHAPWLFQKRANAKTEKDFQQEIMAEFLGSGDTVITPKTIMELGAGIKNPQWTDQLPNGQMMHGLWCWADRVPGHNYLISVDTATGHGKDFSVMQIIDCDIHEQVAEYKGQVPTDKMGELVKEVARYYWDAYVIIECNNPGPAVFNEIFKSKIDPYYNGYLITKSGQQWGWDTTPKTRILMIEDYFKDVENKRTRIYSKRLLEEIKTFSWQENGKPEANKGYNDDLVISWSIYAHLWETALGSRPIGLVSSRNKAVDINTPTFSIDWSLKENQYQEMYGCSIEEYYWLQGQDLPDEYVRWLKDKEEKFEESLLS